MADVAMPFFLSIQQCTAGQSVLCVVENPKYQASNLYSLLKKTHSTELCKKLCNTPTSGFPALLVFTWHSVLSVFRSDFKFETFIIWLCHIEISCFVEQPEIQSELNWIDIRLCVWVVTFKHIHNFIAEMFHTQN